MRKRSTIAAAIATLALSGSIAFAAPAPKKPDANTGPPNAVQGFSQNRDQPVHIEAARLEVRDKDKVATFSGNVQVIQGDVEMRCRTLVVFYEQESAAPAAANNAKAMQAANPGPGGEQRIKRLEAKGSVVVTQNDQVATGEVALFDMATNTVTMIGKVVVTQGPNVLRGDRLVVDMTTGLSRFDPGEKGDGRVQGLFLPGSATMPGPNAPPSAVNKPATSPAPAPAAPQRQMPMRLN